MCIRDRCTDRVVSYSGSGAGDSSGTAVPAVPLAGSRARVKLCVNLRMTSSFMMRFPRALVLLLIFLTITGTGVTDHGTKLGNTPLDYVSFSTPICLSIIPASLSSAVRNGSGTAYAEPEFWKALSPTV